jgi:hypothetical protein
LYENPHQLLHYDLGIIPRTLKDIRFVARPFSVFIIIRKKQPKPECV